MEIVIPKRFCGPPTSGNGGYTCGRIAAFIDGAAAGVVDEDLRSPALAPGAAAGVIDKDLRSPALALGAAEITLKSPPPLETPLRVEKHGVEVKVMHGGREIAHGKPIDLQLDVPSPPSWAEAEAAGKRYNGLREHYYGTCFVCGPQRAPRDGLRIFCGPWRGGVVAGTWVPDDTLADGNGRVAPEFLWSAIDCPGEWSVVGRDDPDAPARGVPSTILLGRLAGQVFRGLAVGEPCTVIGWCIATEARKHLVGAAVHTRDGALVAASRATWIALKNAGGAAP